MMHMVAVLPRMQDSLHPIQCLIAVAVLGLAAVVIAAVPVLQAGQVRQLPASIAMASA
jgi:hypothetical protein